MTDYYHVLGVIPDAEVAVIRAAYRALISLYHPDKNPDLAAQEKVKAINEAYSILSDPIKKREYDKTLKGNSANSTAFDQASPLSTDPLEKSWTIAVGFYPYIQMHYENLGKISGRLAFAFKLHLSESQDYKNSQNIALKLKTEYLIRYFGKNNAIIDYAELLIVAREIKAALYLNEIVNVMGTSVDHWQVKRIIEQKFPGTQRRIRGYNLYQQLNNPTSGYYYACVEDFAAYHGAKIKRSFWSGRVTLTIESQTMTFAHNGELRKFLISHFSKLYA